MTDPRRAARPPKPRGQPPVPSEIERAGGGSLPVRPDRYLIAASSPQEATRLVNQLDQDPQVRLVRTIRPAQRLGAWDFPPVLVAETTADRAATLGAQPNLHVEVDHALGYGDMWLRGTDPGLTPITEPVRLAFAVTDTDGHPLAGAAVHVLGEQFREHGITDAEGRAQVLLPADEMDRVQGVYVRPAQGNWSVWLTRPALSTTEPNAVLCHPLESGLSASWHRRAMGFDRLPPHYLGHGVRVAVIDSGATPASADLSERVTEGLDVLTQDDKSWREDVLGIGSQVCGLIAASDESARHVALAPEADLHVCRLMPGGRHSDLIDALDYCLTHDVDVAHIGVGSGQWSPLLAQKIEQARQAGIICVAAAGNTGAAATFPASLPIVLGVGALGQLGTYPPDSYHATQAQGVPSSDGLFLARFSAFGPGVDVFAPGVAVISTVPAGSFGAADGTSIAAAHVAGLAALILAHHPDFRDGYRVRGAARVDRLRQAIIAASRPVMFGNPRYLAGLPDAVAAIGLASPAPPMLGPIAMALAAYPPALLLGAGPPVPPRVG
jgi:subtilisin family serine protease